MFVPDYENGSRPYIPKAKSFMENKAVAGFAQKTGDLVRFAGRRTDQLRRDVDERERVRLVLATVCPLRGAVSSRLGLRL